MVIIGNKELSSNFKLHEIAKKKDLKELSGDKIVFFGKISKRLKLAKYCIKNRLEYAVVAKNIADVLYANIERASYIIVPQSLAKEAQELADNYMFDSKILQIIDKDEELESVALSHIDGAVYRSALNGDS